MLSSMMRTADAALQAEIEEEANREMRRELMLQQAADPQERQQLEQAFALERAQATRRLMERAAGHEAALRSRCNHLKTATLDKRQVLAGKSKPTLLHGKAVRKVPAPMPLHSRNWPVQMETNDEEVIVTWAARNAIRANRNAKVLRGVFPSKSKPSPFESTQELHDKNNKIYPVSSTPLPGRCSPLLEAKEDPLITAPFLRQRKALPQAELVIFDSAPSTPLMRSRISLEVSADTFGETDHSAPPLRKDLSGGTESIGEQSVGAQTPGPRPVTTPYRGVASGSAPRRMKSTSPILGGTSLRRGVSVISLQSALSASLSEQGSRPGTPLTATRDRCVQWDEATKEHIASTLSNVEKLRGELFSEANVAATMAHAHIEVTKREIIRTAVDIPAGSALGRLSRDRPVTVQENRAISQDAKTLLRSRLSGTSSGSLRHNRHHSFHRRAVACRPVERRQNQTHYENVRLRTVICDLIDRVILKDGDDGTEESDERALGESIAQLADNDLTSALSLFPGILQVLFGILDKTGSQASCRAAAKALLHLARQPQVQLTLIQGSCIRRNQAIQYSEMLHEQMDRSNDSSLTLLYAKLITCLCQTEAGYQTCLQSGLLALMERLGGESDDPQIQRILENAKVGPGDADTSITFFDAGRSVSRGEEGIGRQKSSSIGSHQSTSPPDTADRKKWKPCTALPVWERPVDVLGISPKRWATSSSRLRRPASPSHRE